MKKFSFARLLLLVMLILLIVTVSIGLSGCSKNPHNQLSHGYEYAMVRLPDGSIVGGRLYDYASHDSIITVFIDGGAYTTHASNVVITMEYD